MVEEQAREGGGSDMKLKDITVKRITPEELPSILCFQLSYKHHTELGKDTSEEMKLLNQLKNEWGV